MTIALQPGRVAFNGQESVSVEVSTVSNFERIHREFRGTDQPVLSVTHAPEMQSMTTQVALEADRKMNILGRFLRTEYSQLQEELADLDVSDREAEAMVGLYSGGDDASLASMLGMESNQVTMLLNGLLEKGLLEEHAEGMALTSLGKLAVSSKIEQVNM